MSILSTGLLRIVLLLALFDAPEPYLPLDLTWDATSEQFVEAVDEFADWNGQEYQVSELESSVDGAFSLVVAQIGANSSTDPDLFAAGFFDPSGSLLAIQSWAMVESENVLTVVTELEDRYPDMDVTYSRHWNGQDRVFLLSSSDRRIRIIVGPEGGHGGWKIVAQVLSNRLNGDLSDLYPDWSL